MCHLMDPGAGVQQNTGSRLASYKSKRFVFERVPNTPEAKTPPKSIGAMKEAEGIRFVVNRSFRTGCFLYFERLSIHCQVIIPKV